MIRVKRLSITNLFGRFTYMIELKVEEQITIIHAPNGKGKTVLLKLLHALFNGSFSTFRKYEFDVFCVEFVDGRRLSVKHLPPQLDLEEEEYPIAYERPYEVELTATNADTQVYSPNSPDKHPGEIRSRFPMGALTRYAPLARVSARKFRDLRTGRVLDYEDAISDYSHYLPERMIKGRGFPLWLSDIRKEFNCELIETQRLLISQERELGDSKKEYVAAVDTYAGQLQKKISETLGEAATLSQSLDRTFPTRLIERLRAADKVVDNKTVVKRLAALEEKRRRLADADLSDHGEQVNILEGETFDESTLQALDEYITDAEKKLEIYDRILPRLELFTSLVNQRFDDKSISVDRESGLIIKDDANVPLELDSLSSGEQHELVLIYTLLFRTTDHTLLLIDEPEISLHISWQKKFLGDLRQILELTPIDVILATHSPQLIGPNIDLLVELES